MQQQGTENPRRVRLLPPGVAERIAAGEVIERPASVVKELVENAIDAGATEIAVLLEDGGKSLIEILDNGHGMPAEDLGLCIQRHATSKLATLDDLERIRTLGFRGEALPSVAAASELSLLSRARGAEDAYELRVGAIGAPVSPEATTFGHFLNSPHGTRVQARSLFSQIPARLKFLKSQGAEVAHVREWLERIALAHPSIGFRLVSDGRAVLTLRPSDEAGRVRAILSDGEDFPLLTATNDLGFTDRAGGSLHVRAHWLQGFSSPQARRLVQVVNGRALRDRMLQQALLAPFRQALLPGQFPAAALFIEIDPAEIDVNVHPTKTEVRFLNSGKVFRAVQSVVESLIAQNGAPGYVGATPNTPDAFSGPSAVSGGGWSYQPSSAPSPRGWQARETTSNFDFTSPAVISEGFQKGPGESRPSDAPAMAAAAAGNPLPASRYVGAVFNTYLMYDLGTELGLVDQHAAHERVRFEKLKRAALGTEAKGPARQALLIPEAVRFDAESRSALESRLSWLEKLGFEAELFGEDTVLFRAIPSAWGTDELRIRLKNLIERTLAYESHPGELDESLFEALASEACHSAVRAGDRLESAEATALVDELFRCEHPWNCPHGRPTVVRVARGRLEEWFQRRV